METLFLFIVVVMFMMAITDLIVGVSNDAVNFLNSAIGSRAASLRQIMVIATAGIIMGAIFSSGMMEVARKGVFNPQYFTIEQIMFLFAAVMLTDIILLDFYNTIALPTSTTVSIVFELMGSALAISFFAVLEKGESISEWGNYINGSRALIIIAGIFLSVVVAFILGWIIQYITRIIVSFEYKKTMRSFGSIFGAAAVALIVAFIVLKGLKGIPFISSDALDNIKDKAGLISLASGLLALLVFQLLIGRWNFSVYRFITLLGTFALAMAFASNDLVNFVGVPIASYDSYMAWKSSGIDATSYTMDALAQPVRTNPLFLLTAGIIMALTLWFSKKAKSVVQTSVNLGRQDEGAERFQANAISRGIVMGFVSVSKTFSGILPLDAREWIAGRFRNTQKAVSEDPMDKPAFDLVRASLNLIVAAGIILAATSMKLPLSTTFVSFMVLMGTSLADRAWAKGSAVYRVSGMLTVIGGWFLTAIIALTVSIIFASLLITFKIYALAALVCLAVILIFRSQVFYRHHRYKAEVNLEMADKWFKTDFFEIEAEVREKLAFILERIDNIYSSVLDALITQDRKTLNELSVLLDDVESTNDLYKVKLTQQIKEVPPQYQEGGKILMLVYDLEGELLYALGNIIRFSSRHINNLHPALQEEQKSSLMLNKQGIHEFMEKILEHLKLDQISDKDYKEFKKTRKGLISNVDQAFSRHIALATSKKLSGKNSELILTILLSSKNMVAACSRLVKLFYMVKTEDMSDMLDKLMEE